MRGAFEDEELETVKTRRDTEVTLGTGALLGLLLGLAVLCVFCFGLGYAVGHRGSTVAALPVPSQPVQSANAIAKPPATAQPDQSPTPDGEDSAVSADGAASGATPAADAQVVPAVATSSGAPVQASVHPALSTAPAQSAQGTPAASVRQRWPPVAGRIAMAPSARPRSWRRKR